MPSLTSYRVALGHYGDGLNDDDEAEHHQMSAVNRVLDYLDRMGLLSAAAQVIIGPRLDDMPYELALLRSLGILPPRKSDSATALCDFPVLVEQLALRARESDAWGTFGAAERSLRGLVDAVLTDKYGLEWPD